MATTASTIATGRTKSAPNSSPLVSIASAPHRCRRSASDVRTPSRALTPLTTTIAAASGTPRVTPEQRPPRHLEHLGAHRHAARRSTSRTRGGSGCTSPASSKTTARNPAATSTNNHRRREQTDDHGDQRCAREQYGARSRPPRRERGRSRRRNAESFVLRVRRATRRQRSSPSRAAARPDSLRPTVQWY